MKKLFVFLMMAVIVGTGTVVAQGGAFGAKVTPMLSWGKTTDNDFYSFESGGVVPSIGFGPSYKKYLGDNFNIDVGLLFTWQHLKYTATSKTHVGNEPDVFNVEPHIQYLQVPVILEASFDITGDLQGLIDFGVSPAFELSSVADVYDNSNTLLQSDYDFKGSFFNFYLNAGAGVSYHLTDELMLSGVFMYNNGIIDVWFDEAEDEADFIHELKLLNHFVSMNIGIHIKF